MTSPRPLRKSSLDGQDRLEALFPRLTAPTRPDPAGPASDLLPIVLGASGHRRLRPEDQDDLADRVRFIFQELRAQVPATPLVLLSGLAEGADRLVARIGLECGASLVVPLPLPRKLYEDDFASPESRREFGDLLAQAESWFELPLPSGVSEEDVRRPGEARDRQDELAGAFLRGTAEILVALWDGGTVVRPGGAAQVVQFQLEDVAPDASLVDLLDAGPVYHILTPRGLPADGGPARATLRKLFPATLEAGSSAGPEAGNAHHLLNQVLRRTDAFNRDILAQVGRPQKTGKEGLAAGATGLDAVFAWADALACHYRKRTRQALALLLGLSLVMALLLQLHFLNAPDHGKSTLWEAVSVNLWQLHFLNEPGHWTAAYLVAFLLAVLCYGWSRRGDFEAEYQDYRAWRRGCVCSTTGGWPASTRRRRTIISGGSGASWNGSGRPCAPAPPCAARPTLGKRGRPPTCRARVGMGARTGGVVRRLGPQEPEDGPGVDGVQARLDGVRRRLEPGGAAGGRAPRGRLGHFDDRGGRRPAALLRPQRCLRRRGQALCADGPPVRAGPAEIAEARRRGWRGGAALLVELGREALAENGDWLLMRRDRPLELPKPG